MESAKYFRNQNPIINNGQTFKDTYFQLTNSDEIEYKRINEIFVNKTVTIFGSRIDISFNSFSHNQHLFSVLERLIEYPSLIFNLFKTKEISQNGFYEINLFIDGEWQIVIIDDYFAINKGTNQLEYAKQYAFTEIWPMLIEKALAKVNESYQNLIRDKSATDYFVALTSFPIDLFNFKNVKKETIWDNLLKINKNNNVVFCNTIDNQKLLDNYGLTNNTIFAIESSIEITLDNENLKFLIVKNLNGNLEWSGAWSKDSHRWTDEAKEKLNYNKLYLDCPIKNKFIIDFDDLVLFFSNFYICKILKDSYHYQLSTNISENSNPDVYNLYLTNNTKELTISLLKQNWKYNRTLLNKNYNSTFHVLIARYNENKNSLQYINGKVCYNDQDLHLFLDNLSQGFYVIWVFCFLEACSEPKPSKHVLKLISSEEIKIKYQTSDKNFELIKEILQSYIYLENINSICSSSSELYVKTKSQFMNTGISYLYINNTSSLKSYKVDFDVTEVENIKVIPEINSLIATSSSKNLYLGFPLNSKQKTNFNISYTFKSHFGQASKPNSYINIKQYIDQDYKNYEGVQTYKLLNSEESILDLRYKSLKFSTQEKRNAEVKDLIGTTLPEVWHEIQNFIEKYPIDESQLIWIDKEEYDNGFYIGSKNLKNQREGVGYYFWESEEKYLGQWKEGNRSGIGVQFGKSNHILYQGRFLDGKKHGYGKLFLTNGDEYEGEFKDDCFNGKGKYFWKDTNITYHGPFEEDNFHGTGLLVAPDGSTQLKQFENGMAVNMFPFTPDGSTQLKQNENGMAVNMFLFS